MHSCLPMHACGNESEHSCVCVCVCVCACLKAATVVAASWGIEINECNQKQTASQARAINTSKASRAAGLLGQAWLEPKRWRIKMQPQTNSAAFPYTQQMSAEGEGAGSLASTHIRQPATRSARPNTSWQPPGSALITPSSLFSSRAKGRPSAGPPRCIRKGTRCEAAQWSYYVWETERDRGT